LTVQQCETIATFSEDYGDSRIQVTNRANLQIRALKRFIPAEVFRTLQSLALAAPIPEVDALRNIMGSPTAGIDSQALLDTGALIFEWNDYLSNHPELAILSPKFSVCFDGGEAVSVRDRPNDIALIAELIDGTVWLRLHLSQGERGEPPQATAVVLQPEQSVSTLAALAEVYAQYTRQSLELATSQRKPRLRELLREWGEEQYLQYIAGRLPFTWQRSQPRAEPLAAVSYAHLGVEAQRQPGLFYVGIVLPLGRLTSLQLHGLARLANVYGQGELRLTPWQTLLIPDVSQENVDPLHQDLKALHLHSVSTHPHSALVACAGNQGCAAAATDTQRDALTLAAQLENYLSLDRPLNIHFSGCSKSCAQHHPADITFLGVADEAGAHYQLYLGKPTTTEIPFLQGIDIERLTQQLLQVLRLYQAQRRDINESYRMFVDRYGSSAIQKILNLQGDGLS
jgi:ferredoxin-nitrite reductase